VETTITTPEGIVATSSVPGGTSTGKNEAVSLPANEAVANIEDIFLEIAGREFNSLLDFDNELISLDGTPNKANLGANSLLSLSMCFCKAEAQFKKIPLFKHINEIGFFSNSMIIPKLMLLVFEGGKHGSGGMDIQEFMYIIDNVENGVLLYKKIKEHLEDEHLSVEVGIEGAFSPLELNNITALKIMSKISSETPIALDIAESSRNGKEINFRKLQEDFKLFSLEDPCLEDDFESWENFVKLHGSNILIVGDDITTTNPARIKKAVDNGCIEGVIIKPNQIGTISETLVAVNLAKSAGLSVIVSHRSGETNDNFIADLAVGCEANFVKFGAPARGERVSKYNRLLEIQSLLFQSIL
jgi:enolase